MPKPKQTFENHRRWFPLYHFVVGPILWIYAAHSIAHTYQDFNAVHVMETLWVLAIAVGAIVARMMALRVQNRLVRLEMRLRLRELLPAPLAARIPELTTRQLIGLRFAGDAELPALVERTLAGEFPNTRAIKRAVTDWQPDYMRV
ncbi:MAG: DUF6526 family protein [Gemmatimonadaceae bacterium]